jgi:hypothetical protein
MVNYVIEQRGTGFGLAGVDHPPVHYADAMHLQRMADAYDRLVEEYPEEAADQGGTGVGSWLKRKLVTAVKTAVKVLPGVRHVQIATKALQHRNGTAKNFKESAPRDHHTMAHLSSMSYMAPDKRLGSGYQSHLSNNEIAVYKLPNKNVVAIRGSAAKGDVITDAALAGGFLGSTGRWKRTKEQLERVKRELGDFELTGHSLGGALALKYAQENPQTKTVVFNPGAGAGDVGQKHGDNSTIYSTVGDTVSAMHGLSNNEVKMILPKGDTGTLSSHGLANFDTHND